MGFVAMSADVGMFLHERRSVQNAADAAALAGAQELPDDVVAAEQIARDYAQKNGVDPSTLDVSFECTSGFVTSCDPSQGRWDTIVVEAESRSPAFFAPVLNLIAGAENCWSDGCTVSATAGACRGLCGDALQAVDVVSIIDHTGSMSSTDLANAKDGTLALMEYFDANIQRVALGVTPPVDPTDHCDSIDSWGDPEVWVPVSLTFDYQSVPNVLDDSSELVSNTECLDRPSSGELPGAHTKLGNPLKAAVEELVANGRPDVKWGVVFLSDGAANIWDAKAQAVSQGPCAYAMKQADAAKAAAIEVFTIAYGADNSCGNDDSSSPWHDRSAVDLLRGMASDDAHFFNEPKTADLEPIFQVIAAQLAGGSRLVR